MCHELAFFMSVLKLICAKHVEIYLIDFENQFWVIGDLDHLVNNSNKQ